MKDMFDFEISSSEETHKESSTVYTVRIYKDKQVVHTEFVYPEKDDSVIATFERAQKRARVLVVKMAQEEIPPLD